MKKAIKMLNKFDKRIANSQLNELLSHVEIFVSNWPQLNNQLFAEVAKLTGNYAILQNNQLNTIDENES